MVKILIIEDDYIWQTKIEMMLSAYTQFEIVGYAENTGKAVQIIETNKPNIIISDLFLGNENVLVTMENVFHDFPTLFLSSHHDEAWFKSVIAYPESAFLIKPFHEYSLLSTLFHLVKHCKHLSEDAKFLSFRGFKSGSHKVKFANIVKIEVEGNYSICYTGDGKKYARKISLNAILKMLDERFLRINKTAVVNLSYVTKIDYISKIVYIGPDAFHIGRPYIKMLRDYNDRY